MKPVLRGLVRLYPAAFRERFGAGVIDDMERDYDRARVRGIAAATWCTLAAAWDLIRSAIAEHLDPSWVRAEQTLEEESAMQWSAQGWISDLRYAVRTLRRSAGFTAVTVGTLGLAIGATTAMFTVVDAVLLNPLPFANVDRLVTIGATAPGSGMPDEFGVAAEFFIQYKESKLLEDVSTYNSFTSTRFAPVIVWSASACRGPRARCSRPSAPSRSSAACLTPRTTTASWS